MKFRKTLNEQIDDILEYLGAEFSESGISLSFNEIPELNGLEVEKQINTVNINYSQLSYLFRGLASLSKTPARTFYQENARFIKRYYDRLLTQRGSVNRYSESINRNSFALWATTC